MLKGTLCSDWDFPSLQVSSAPKLIEPFLAAGSITLLFGTPSAGKSMLMTTMMRAMAAGAAFLDTFTCAAVPVLVVQADMNTVSYQERLRASEEHRSTAIQLLLTDATSFDVTKVAVSDPLVIAARETKPSVVFVDTLRKTHLLDENDASAADRVYGAWRTLFPGAAFVFLHHTRKIAQQALMEDAVTREAFRGNTAWAASADTLMLLKRSFGKGDWKTRLTFVRTRGCEEPESLTLTKTDELLLEVVHDLAIDRKLREWQAKHLNATRQDGVAWLLEQTTDKGEPLCSRATAYRVWERISP